jgi:hypothetical protein
LTPEAEGKTDFGSSAKFIDHRDRLTASAMYKPFVPQTEPRGSMTLLLGEVPIAQLHHISTYTHQFHSRSHLMCTSIRRPPRLNTSSLDRLHPFYPPRIDQTLVTRSSLVARHSGLSSGNTPRSSSQHGFCTSNDTSQYRGSIVSRDVVLDSWLTIRIDYDGSRVSVSCECDESQAVVVLEHPGLVICTGPPLFLTTSHTTREGHADLELGSVM